MYFTFSILIFYYGMFSIHYNGVVGQYASDYFDTVDKDVTPYYAPRAKQFDEVGTANEDIALVRPINLREIMKIVIFYELYDWLLNYGK